MTLELINPADLHTPQSHTHVVAATGSRLVFVAGQADAHDATQESLERIERGLVLRSDGDLQPCECGGQPHVSQVRAEAE